MLLSYAAHGLSTASLMGMGEITLRDGLIVATAAAAARKKQAWILDREVTPEGWSEAAVDLVASRNGNDDAIKMVGGIELKFWRKEDAGNAANRRKDLIRDFIRAAALYKQVEHFSFVALLSTHVSWENTVSTSGKDKPVMSLLNSDGVQKWNLRNLAGSSGLKSAVQSLERKVPISSSFHTELISKARLSDKNGDLAFSRVWVIKKPQNSIILEGKNLDPFRKKVEANKAIAPTPIAVTDAATQPPLQS